MSYSIRALPLWLVLVWFCVGKLTANIRTKLTFEEHLHSHLFIGYNPDLHPAFQKSGESSKVTVKFDAQVIRIIELSERDQYIKTYLWVNQYWNNPRMVWNASHYGNVDSIHVAAAKVWVPDIVLYNNVGTDSGLGSVDIYKQKVSIKSNGDHTWMNQVIYTSICKIDVSYFPFDDQNCKLKFGSWSFDVSKIDMRFVGGKFEQNDYYVPNGGWELRHLNATRNELFYQCCPQPFVDITVELALRRVAFSYTLNLIIPSALLSSLALLGFILPPESGERVSLSITILLSVTVFQQLTSSIMPQYDFPYMARYYFITIVATGLSLVVTTVVLMLYHRKEGRMPNWLKYLLFKILGPLLCFRFHCDKENEDPAILRVTALSGDGQQNDKNSSGNGSTNERIPLTPRCPRFADIVRNRLESPRDSEINNEFGIVARAMSKLEKAMAKKRMEEWRKAARVLDRFFLFVFLIIIGLNFALIFLQSPRFRSDD